IRPTVDAPIAWAMATGLLVAGSTSPLASTSVAAGPRPIETANPHERMSPGGIAAGVVALVDAGRFVEAEARIAAGLSTGQVDIEHGALAYERERMRRIRLDFRLSEDDVREAVRKQIPDLTDREFAR